MPAPRKPAYTTNYLEPTKLITLRIAQIAAKPVITINAIVNTGAVSTATPVKSKAAKAGLQKDTTTQTNNMANRHTFVFKLITPFHS